MNDSTLDHLLRLSEFKGRIQGVIDGYDENFIDAFGAVLRIKELLAVQEQLEQIQE